MVVVGEGRVGADVEGDVEGVGGEEGLGFFLEGFVCEGLLAGCGHFIGYDGGIVMERMVKRDDDG